MDACSSCQESQPFPTHPPPPNPANFRMILCRRRPGCPGGHFGGKRETHACCQSGRWPDRHGGAWARSCWQQALHKRRAPPQPRQPRRCSVASSKQSVTHKQNLIRPKRARFRGNRARLRIYAGQKGDFRRCGQDGASKGNFHARAGDVRGIGAFIRSSQDRTTHSKDFDDTVRHYRPCVDRGPRRWRGPSEQDKRAHGWPCPHDSRHLTNPFTDAGASMRGSSNG
jgi:hypothetical protein